MKLFESPAIASLVLCLVAEIAGSAAATVDVKNNNNNNGGLPDFHDGACFSNSGDGRHNLCTISIKRNGVEKTLHPQCHSSSPCDGEGELKNCRARLGGQWAECNKAKKLSDDILNVIQYDKTKVDKLFEGTAGTAGADAKKPKESSGTKASRPYGLVGDWLGMNGKHSRH